MLPALEGLRPTAEERRKHAERVAAAAELMSSALSRAGPLAHPGRDDFTEEQARRVLASWERQLGR